MNLLVESGPWGNLGDISMVEAVVLQLRSLLPEATIHVLVPQSVRSPICDAPEIIKVAPFTVEPVGDRALSRLRFFRHHKWLRQRATSTFTVSALGRFLRAGSLSLRFEGRDQERIQKLTRFCERFDGLHIAGGGNLTETFLHEFFRKCCLIHAFYDQHKPIVLTGQQLGPFTSQLLRGALGKTLKMANFVGLRDPGESVSICRQAHLDPRSFAVMGDDSLGLPPADESVIRALLEQYGLKENGFVALNLRFTTYGLTDPSCFEWFASLVNRLGSFFGMPILVVPVHLAGPDSDIVSGQKIAARCSVPISVMRGSELTAPLVKGILAKAFGAVGVSHHCCTYALSQGVPAVCIYEGDYYGQKAGAIVACWGDDRLALPLKRLDPARAAEHIACVLKDEALRQKLVSLSKAASERWFKLLRQRVMAAYPCASLPLEPQERNSELVGSRRDQ
jgi:polysaccharide pyruvyl transferase WcaK-like protein